MMAWVAGVDVKREEVSGGKSHTNNASPRQVVKATHVMSVEYP
jgi:hypothetical protein